MSALVKYLEKYANAADIAPIYAQTALLLSVYMVLSIPLGFHLIFTLISVGLLLLINLLSVLVYGQKWLTQPSLLNTQSAPDTLPAEPARRAAHIR